jgi:hypothetical protein
MSRNPNSQLRIEEEVCILSQDQISNSLLTISGTLFKLNEKC